MCVCVYVCVHTQVIIEYNYFFFLNPFLVVQASPAIILFLILKLSTLVNGDILGLVLGHFDIPC